MGRRARGIAALLLAGLLGGGRIAPAAADLNVVVTIKPLHALVAQVMGRAGTPELLVKGAASPHTYALKPSDASRLNEADIFFRMSDSDGAVHRQARQVAAEAGAGGDPAGHARLKLYPRRTGATFDDDHDHGARRGS